MQNKIGTPLAVSLDPQAGFGKLRFRSRAIGIRKQAQQVDQSRTNIAFPLPVERPLEESQHDFDFPQREAAFFYGLFLRGHSPEELRRDIEVPAHVLARWHRQAEREPEQRATFERILEYRRSVLAIFESLLSSDAQKQPVQ